MGQAGQFGDYYTQIVDRFYRALEWRYNDVKDQKGHEREAEIVARLLDLLLADQVGHDIPLAQVEAALRAFQKVRNDSYSPLKYKEILQLMDVKEAETHGYVPQLFGAVTLEVGRQA